MSFAKKTHNPTSLSILWRRCKIHWGWLHVSTELSLAFDLVKRRDLSFEKKKKKEEVNIDLKLMPHKKKKKKKKKKKNSIRTKYQISCPVQEQHWFAWICSMRSLAPLWVSFAIYVVSNNNYNNFLCGFLLCCLYVMISYNRVTFKALQKVAHLVQRFVRCCRMFCILYIFANLAA